MQVFEFQLGSAASGTDPKEEWTLPALEIQFGAELIKSLPILSQSQNIRVSDLL
ncbi:hypothetical protein HD806DRAFT_505251 [Xylariaceae sp. AK1471]|nr:hypothetical protein HD806DRAFT_505251 [Xylariaceae sp. AK1471]